MRTLSLLALLVLAPAAAAALSLGPLALTPAAAPYGVAFAAGADHAEAAARGFAGPFEAGPEGQSFALDVHGIPGGTVVVDRLVEVRKDPGVPSYRLELAGSSGNLEFTRFYLRLWTGTEPPRSDGDPGVCAVLDLAAAPGTMSGPCRAEFAHGQLAVALPDGAAGARHVELRPTDVAPAAP